MKRLTINPSNKPYYSEDFIKGFEYGTQRQLEADLADRPQGEWETVGEKTLYKRCPFCKRVRAFPDTRCCDWCGAKMKGADDE